jgi:hypothetical protein
MSGESIRQRPEESLNSSNRMPYEDVANQSIAGGSRFARGLSPRHPYGVVLGIYRCLTTVVIRTFQIVGIRSLSLPAPVFGRTAG